uniref:Uncharacterized protein n=1 Tax=Siphoviridae sp. ctsoB6 TaxID=2826487 RepID=A0A8S5QP01_9CAUD|nr:MAG TPA: hypothetical protein [Siphoviridae sp. ctsoB6]
MAFTCCNRLLYYRRFHSLGASHDRLADLDGCLHTFRLP